MNEYLWSPEPWAQLQHVATKWHEHELQIRFELLLHVGHLPDVAAVLIAP